MEMKQDEVILNNSLEYLKTTGKASWSFWIDGAKLAAHETAPKALCDVIYTLYLLGNPTKISMTAIEHFFDVVNRLKLYGSRVGTGERYELSPHNTAYVLGCIRILRSLYPEFCSKFYLTHDWDFHSVLSEKMIPKYPRKFIYHPWRVSHWLGGTPSIIYNIYKETQQESYETLLHSVLSAIEKRVLTDKGLIKLHKNGLFNFLFRTLYNLRHNPKNGDIGGIVHIYWIYYTCGRKFPYSEQLLDLSIPILMSKDEFIENIPYCLDFDFVQLVRTLMKTLGREDTALDNYFLGYRDRLKEFLSLHIETSQGFTLHKLPGALAALNECELFISKDQPKEASVFRSDIIQLAAWL